MNGAETVPRDALGWWYKFGVMGPSTYTVVRPDLEYLHPLRRAGIADRVVGFGRPMEAL